MMQQRDPQLAKIRRRAPIESNITNCNGITYFMCDGRTKTTFELLQSFYWPGIRMYLKYVESCHNCQISVKAGQHPAKAP